MKNKTYLLNTLLAVVVGIAMLVIMLLHTFLPSFIMPKLTIPNLMIPSLIALVLDHYLAGVAKRSYICIPVFATITFGLLPWIAGYIPANEIWKAALGGAAVFTAATLLFSAIRYRLASGPAYKLAPLISVFGLYLASQCFSNILLK